jgi:hypothetical protein
LEGIDTDAEQGGKLGLREFEVGSKGTDIGCHQVGGPGNSMRFPLAPEDRACFLDTGNEFLEGESTDPARGTSTA